MLDQLMPKGYGFAFAPVVPDLFEFAQELDVAAEQPRPGKEC